MNSAGEPSTPKSLRLYLGFLTGQSDQGNEIAARLRDAQIATSPLFALLPGDRLAQAQERTKARSTKPIHLLSPNAPVEP